MQNYALKMLARAVLIALVLTLGVAAALTGQAVGPMVFTSTILLAAGIGLSAVAERNRRQSAGTRACVRPRKRCAKVVWQPFVNVGQ